MVDLTPLLNELLKSHDAPPTANPSLSLQKMDGFIQEAYTIVGLHCLPPSFYICLQVTEYTYSQPQRVPEKHSGGLLRQRLTASPHLQRLAVKILVR